LMVGVCKGDEAGTGTAEGNGRCPSIISRLHSLLTARNEGKAIGLM
jgi:hypothetical protein